jgi:death-associated protein kinase
MSGFCEAVQHFLPKLRKIANPFPVLSWKTFCDTIHLEVNPLATNQHLNILLIQLQNLGEVSQLVFLKNIIFKNIMYLLIVFIGSIFKVRLTTRSDCYISKLVWNKYYWYTVFC